MKNPSAPAAAAPREGIDAAVGRAIRELRQAGRLTARDLAERAGISPAMLSRVETGRVSASLATLASVAAALDVPIPALFRGTPSPVADFTHTREGEGLRSVRIMGEHVHEYAVLGFHRRPDLQFECHMVTLERREGAEPPTYTGRGCVFVHVLEGSAVYRYGDRRLRLEPGDSLCLDAELRYGIQEVLSPRLRFLTVQAERR